MLNLHSVFFTYVGNVSDSNYNPGDTNLDRNIEEIHPLYNNHDHFLVNLQISMFIHVCKQNIQTSSNNGCTCVKESEQNYSKIKSVADNVYNVVCTTTFITKVCSSRNKTCYRWENYCLRYISPVQQYQCKTSFTKVCENTKRSVCWENMWSKTYVPSITFVSKCLRKPAP